MPFDLQRQAHEVANPFDEEPPRINAYTAQEIAILQSRLAKQLGPEYISTRKGPGGGNVHYLAADKVIALANEVFGFNGWSTSIRETTIDYVDMEKDGRVSMGLSMVMRVTLRDGTFHEDIGYGMISNCSGKGAAFEKTKKEAATDALKRALRNFGNVLGNCLYDKEYLKKVVKIKAPPTKFSEESLHRHQSVAPSAPPMPQQPQQGPRVQEVKTEGMMNMQGKRTMSEQSRVSMATDYDDEFGGNAFDDLEFTRSDEFVINENSTIEEANESRREEHGLQARQAPQRTHSMPPARPQLPAQNNSQRPPMQHAHSRPPAQQRPGAPSNLDGASAMAPPGNGAPRQQSNGQNAMQRPQQPPQQQNATNASTPEGFQDIPLIQPHAENGQQVPETPVGFVRGGAILQGQNGQTSATALFNPHAESPSIRKTNGFNHRTSGPVRREDVGKVDTGASVAPAPAALMMRPPVAQATNAANAPPPQNNGFQPPSRSNFVNPQFDSNRRIGAPQPAGMQSPGPRAGAYKPPGPAGVKRGPPDTIQRQPLGDVSNINPPADAGGGNTDKKVKVNNFDDSGVGGITA